MTTKTEQIAKAYEAGCISAYVAMKVSEQTKVPFYVLCAFLEQETAGGYNEFGHDPTIFVGAGTVTKKKYLAYKEARDADLKTTGKRHMQGVGPMQLTWYSFQDQADALGGCWVPEINTLVGAQIISGYWHTYKDWHKVAKAYNGAESYAVEMDTKLAKWKQVVS